MGKLRKIHILGGTLALLCILWNIFKIMEAFKIDWQKGPPSYRPSPLVDIF